MLLQIKFAGMMQYDGECCNLRAPNTLEPESPRHTLHFLTGSMCTGELKLPKCYLVPPPFIEHPTGEFLVHNGVSLYASAESQKIGHVRLSWLGDERALGRWRSLCS